MNRKLAALCLLALAAVVFAASARADDAPPIKMGLWKSNNVMTMGGIQLPPDVEAKLKASGRSLGGEHTVQSMSCLTPEKWQEMMGKMNGNKDCVYTNRKMSAEGISADLECHNSDVSSSTGHVEMVFDSTEKAHGTMHMSVTTRQMPQPMTLDGTFQTEYQGSDCQGISPDSPKIIH
jgi:hypothetical protein